MTIDLSGTSWGPATVLTVLLVLTAAIGGMVLVVMGDLSFEGWIETMTGFAVAAGLLGVGRGIARGGLGTGFTAPAPPPAPPAGNQIIPPPPQ